MNFLNFFKSLIGLSGKVAEHAQKKKTENLCFSARNLFLFDDDWKNFIDDFTEEQIERMTQKSCFELKRIIERGMAQNASTYDIGRAKCAVEALRRNAAEGPEWKQKNAIETLKSLGLI